MLIHSQPKERRLSRGGWCVWRRPPCALALSVSCLLASATSGAAGTISIRTEVKATAQPGKLAVAMNILNSGDETARSVVAAASFSGHDVRASARPALAPGTAMAVTFELPWSQTMPGQWPLTTTVDYEDGNGYAFQALQVALVSSPGASPTLIAIIDVDVQPVASSGGVSVRLKSLSPLPRDARLTFFVPRGLEVDVPARPLSLAPWADAEVKAQIINRAALPGSRYLAFVTVEYDDADGHHAAIAHGMVEVHAAKAYAHQGRVFLVAAAALTTIWVLLVVWRRWRGGRKGAQPLSPPPAASGPPPPAA